MTEQPSRSQREKVALVSCMRNEGLFVLEWVAYHALLGFDDILVFTNSCTSGSELFLRLASSTTTDSSLLATAPKTGCGNLALAPWILS